MEPTSNRRVRAKLQSRACEACRVAKIRCQPGPQSDICKRGRCSSNKRECVFRAAPRSRRSKVVEGATPLPPPPGPSQSFTIDFAVPADEEPMPFLEDIERFHEAAMEELMPLSDDGIDGNPFTAGPTGSSSAFGFGSPSVGASPAAGSGPKRPLNALGLQPQFNLLSAQTLLDQFRDMLPHCPLLVWPDRADVKFMAKESPFLLLAILAAVSCSVNLQGHNLYDEEFRKVLGLKFVTGGERSLELLQGVLIYLAWYPHHLRPKSPVRTQYGRIATDIVRDLNLDQDTAFADHLVTGLTHQDMQSIRAFVACFYLDSILSTSWQRPSTFPSVPWVMRCCDLLEQHSLLDQDHTLVWLARLGNASGEMVTLHKRAQKPDAQEENQLRLLHLGLEAQLQEWQAQIPAAVATSTSIKLALIATASFHAAAPLVKPKLHPGAATGLLLDAARLTALAHALRATLDATVALAPADLNRLCAGDWCHLVGVIIVAVRLSLPLAACPLFDAARARSILDLGAYFARFGHDNDDDDDDDGRSRNSSSRASSRTAAAAATATPSTEDGDMAAGSSRGRGRAARKLAAATCASAFRVVLRSLKAKYEAKVAAAEAQTAAAAAEMARVTFGCPMVDGSLTDYLPLWDGPDGFVMPEGHPSVPISTSGASQSGSLRGLGASAKAYTGPTVPGTTMQQHEPQQGLPEPLVFDDLWSTMTMGWAAEDVLDLGAVAQQGQVELL